MEKIPFDIFINHIMPYAYHIQPKILLEDIKNYYSIKTILINGEYDAYDMKEFLLRNYYLNKQRINHLLDKRFKKKNYDNIYNYSQNKQFNIVFGLISSEERTLFSEYVSEQFHRWMNIKYRYLRHPRPYF